MKQFTKRYQLWILSEGNNYSLTEFDTLEELIAEPKFSDWYVTQRVILRIYSESE